MILITSHGPALVSLELLDMHRLQVLAPPPQRKALRTLALHDMVTDPARSPGTTWWCTRVLIAADATIYYTPGGVPIAANDEVRFPPPGPPPTATAADPDRALEFIAHTITGAAEALARPGVNL